MRKMFLPFLITFLSLTSCSPKFNIKEFNEWLNDSTVNILNVSLEEFAEIPLSRTEIDIAGNLLFAHLQDRYRIHLKEEWDRKCITQDSLKMYFAYRVFGEKPVDGRSLYISMHGGGNTAREVNNQQWRNQMVLYTPEEGLYVAPRAPWDDWNMWFRPEMDEFLDRLIQSAVLFMDVNPDKVYSMGYSAGGDGVYRLAPRLADRWAAASMMAGHPGEAMQLNLRNLPFSIWMGEHDAAYNRNDLAINCGKILDSLHADDPQGYIHQTHIVEGKGHWMERVDTMAVEWMSQYKRNPYPKKVVWRQEQVANQNSFYWLSVNSFETYHGKTVRANIKDNTIYITECDYSKLTILLNDSLVDLDKPVTVYYQDKIKFKGKVPRTLATLSQTWNKRFDAGRFYYAYIDIIFNDYK